MKKVLFISSTGGHLNELLQLKPLFEKYDSYIVTEKTKSNKDLCKKYKNVYYLVYGTKLHMFSYFFKFSFNIIKSFILFIRIRPKVIVTTGTHTAVPMCYIAKLLYPIADTFIVQWEDMLKIYPKAIYGGWIY